MNSGQTFEVPVDLMHPANQASQHQLYMQPKRDTCKFNAAMDTSF